MTQLTKVQALVRGFLVRRKYRHFKMLDNLFSEEEAKETVGKTDL